MEEGKAAAEDKVNQAKAKAKLLSVKKNKVAAGGHELIEQDQDLVVPVPKKHKKSIKDLQGIVVQMSRKNQEKLSQKDSSEATTENESMDKQDSVKASTDLLSQQESLDLKEKEGEEARSKLVQELKQSEQTKAQLESKIQKLQNQQNLITKSLENIKKQKKKISD